MSLRDNLKTEKVRERYDKNFNSVETTFTQKELEEHDRDLRNRAIDEAIKASSDAICVGCGYLDGHKCTYEGSNCGVSKPMLESVIKALEQLKKTEF